jgi:D-amino-acid dehydrogenase
MVERHAPLRIRPDGSWFQLRWMAQMLRECTPARYAVNKERLMRVAEYSGDCLRELRAETGLAYEQRSAGTLQVFRTQAQLDAVQRDVRVLQDLGVPFERAGPRRRGARRAGPGARTRAAHGRAAPAQRRDGRLPCLHARARAARRRAGRRLSLRESVQALRQAGGAVDGVVLARPAARDGAGRPRGACAGQLIRALLEPLGLDLPVYPVKGYSLTYSPGRPLPRAAVHGAGRNLQDRAHALRRTAARGRHGRARRLRPAPGPGAARNAGEKVTRELFRGDLAQAQFWTGLRPMTPDSTPVIGATALRGRTPAYGTLGWTMACGSARLLADLMTGLLSAIRADDLSLARYAASRPAAATRPRARPASA